MRFHLLSLLWLLGAVPARADAPRSAAALEKGQGALAALRYPEALSAASTGIAAGDATPETLAALYRVQAEAAAVMGDAPASEDAFARYLQLMPGARLPPDVSPKLRRPFERAQARQATGRFRLQVTSRALADDWVQSEIVVEHDPHRLVQSLHLERFDGEAPPIQVQGRTVSWRCPTAPCRHALAARDLHGNVVARAGSPLSPLLIEPRSMGTSDEGARPLWRQPVVHLVGAGLLAVTGGVLAWRFADAQGRLQSATEAPGTVTYRQAQEWDAQRRAIHPWMWVSFAGAGALSGTALLVW